MIIAIIVIVSILAIASQSSTENEHAYTAEFGEVSQHLSMFNHGFSIGSYSLPKLISHQNAACFGPTGSGKTSTVTIPTLISLARGKSSILVNDSSGGELYLKTSDFFRKKGDKVLRCNFTNAELSETFNPLLEVKSVSDAQKLALILVRNTQRESKSDPFWEHSSIMLISLFIRYLVFHCDKEVRTLQNVLRLVERFAFDGNAVNKLFLKTQDEELLQTYKATLSTGEKTLQSIIASARTALNLWNDKEVCKATMTNSIDFSLLRKEPVVLYVITPLKDIEYLKPLTASFFQSAFNHVLTEIPSRNARSIFFVLEEAATLSFPNLSTTISNVRKFSAGILLSMQDELALTSRYGAAEAHQIKTNCGCQIYLKGQPLSTCKELSQILGRFTYDNNKTRELLTPDELRMCDDAIVLLENYAPLVAHQNPITKVFGTAIWEEVNQLIS